MIWTSYGPPNVLQIAEIDTPKPKDHEVLVKVHAGSVTAGDCELRRFSFGPILWLPLRILFGLFKPKPNSILGQEFSGRIEAVGPEVTRFVVGDEIFAITGFTMGAYAQYKCMSGTKKGAQTLAISHKPSNMSFDEAATVPTGGLNAMHFLRISNVQRGDKLLVIGAGGSIGTFTVQLAKHLGAEITAVDSAEKLPMLTSIGADHVIDYQHEDYASRENTYDVIIDIVGTSPFKQCVQALKENGRYVLGNPKPVLALRGIWISKTTSKKVLFRVADCPLEDLETLKSYAEDGTIRTVIDKTYPLEQLAEAHAYVDSGRKIGGVAISIAPHD